MRTHDKRLACAVTPTHVSFLLDPTLELGHGHVDVDDHVGRQVLADGDLLHLVVVVHTWYMRDRRQLSANDTGF